MPTHGITEEMDEFLEMHRLPRLKHEEIKNLTRPVLSKVIDSVIKTSQHRKARNQRMLAGKLYSTFKELRPILLKLFQKIEEEGTLQNSFMRPVLYKDTTRKKITALAGVAQWIECWPANQKVTSSIPSQGTCLGLSLIHI